MKSILFLLFILIGNWTLAQSRLDTKLATFAERHQLYNSKLEKLETIQRNRKLSEKKRTQKWEAAYSKWDRKNATDSLNAEEMLIDALPGLRNKYRGKVGGYNLDYLLFRLSKAEEEGNISLDSRRLLEQVLLKQMEPKREIVTDVKEMSKRAKEFFLTNGKFEGLSMFIEKEYGSTGRNLDGFIKFCENLSMGNRAQLKQSLIENKVSYWDVINIKEIESFPTQTLVGDNLKTLLSKDTKFREGDYLLYADFYNDPVIRKVIHLRLLLNSFLEMEAIDLKSSKIGENVKAHDGIDGYSYLFLFEYNFNDYNKQKIIPETDLSVIQKLLVSSYNDVYYYMEQDARSIEKWNSKKVDLSELGLSAKQHGIIDAIQQIDPLMTRTRLNDLMSIELFQELEWDLEFKLACFYALYYKSMSLTNDWNKSEFDVSPFVKMQNQSKQTFNNIDSTAWNQLKIDCRNSLENAGYGNTKFTITHDGRGKMICSPKVSKNRGLNDIIGNASRSNAPLQYFRLIVETGEVKKITGPVKLKEVDTPPRRVTYPSERVYAVPPQPLPLSKDDVKPILQAVIIDFPDLEASFPGGSEAMKAWIKENLLYPEISKELGDQGRVYVTFVVEPDGSITGIDVMRGGVTDELNREAKRLIRTMPKWMPGETKGKAVRARCRIPISFTLGMDD